MLSLGIYLLHTDIPGLVMMTNCTLIASALFLAISLALGDVAQACSCVPQTGTPRAQVVSAKRAAAAIFAGTVTGVELDSGNMRVTVRFTVRRIWKGRLSSEVAITTGAGGGDCGYRFTLGSQYVVYCYGDTIDELSTNICTRTRLEGEADPDLRYLGRAKRTRS